MTDPAEKSICPAASTRQVVSDKIPTIDAYKMMLIKFVKDKKYGEQTEKNMIITA